MCGVWIVSSELRGPVRASAAASSEASAASSSAAEAPETIRGEERGLRRVSLHNNIISYQHLGYITPATMHFSVFERYRDRSFFFFHFLFFFSLTSSSFFLMRHSASTSGVVSGSRGMGLSTRLSAFILLWDQGKNMKGDKNGGIHMGSCYTAVWKSACKERERSRTAVSDRI